MSSAPAEKVGDWPYLWRELKRRTTEPVANVPFVFYVLLAIVGLGCVGIWVELVKLVLSEKKANLEGLLTALATFSPALIGSAALQLILASTGRGDKVMVSVGLFIALAAFAAVILISAIHKSFPITALLAALAFVAIAVWLWWITNGDDPTFKSVPLDAPSGGSIDRELPGDTDGFKS